MSAAEANRPLDGLVVIDLSQIYNGPYATFLIATGGATVIKIEPPGGEPLRQRGAVGGAALPFAMLNGCKKSVVLDLKSEAGKTALLALVKDADVSSRILRRARWTVSASAPKCSQTINPRLIYASSSGFGSDGPYRELSGDGPHRAGDVRRHEHDRLRGSSAGEGGAGAVRLLRRCASLRRDRDGTL